MRTNDKLSGFRRANAKRLRANTTSAEDRLWRALDRVPLVKTHFRRQAPIGPYVVDFVSLRARLVIELDGPSHTQPGAAEKDARRTAWLESEGYRVLRFWNADVFDNIDGVLDTIHAAFYPPSPQAEGEVRRFTLKGKADARFSPQAPRHNSRRAARAGRRSRLRNSSRALWRGGGAPAPRACESSGRSSASARWPGRRFPPSSPLRARCRA
ncbi:endonuclease domain-containing protein [Methylocystis hirsuta]|uniref:Endonuclease domain-containing protein n=1 Tax=Methylocystis hirsuta TaxID=369798 RepID=A0A3M9XN52_9HYPH|nr:endonuclease domain-containing protein [Methylocystis hirsuta]